MNAPSRISLSVIVTAMNEEGNLTPSVESVLSAVAPPSFDYEIIIIDDGSTDDTARIADGLAASNPRIRVHHQPHNLGLDRAYLKGIELASKQFVGWVAGNNMIPAEALRDIYGRIGKADLILGYPVVDIRRKRRRWLSRAFVQLLNILFGVRVRYFTGPCVFRAEAGKSLRVITRGSMVVPEIVLRLLKSGETVQEVSLRAKPRTSGRTKTFRPRNLVSVATSVLRLFIDIQVLGHGRRRPSTRTSHSSHLTP
jgi:glycosyltransferase involved in cell wall biosynthesis